jgi:hypothetical protein
MSSTIVQIDEFAVTGFVLARLEEAESGIVAPDAAGHAITTQSESKHTFTVSGAQVGLYRLSVEDGDGIEVLQGWVDILADDAGPYIASGSIEELHQARLRRKQEAMLEDDGSSGFQFTALSLANAPGLDAAAVRSAVGLVAANLDTQLAAIVEDTSTTIPAVLVGILEDTGTSLPATLAEILTDTGTTLPNTLAAIVEDTGTTLPASLSAIQSLLIDAQPVYTSPLVSPLGSINGPIVIGDDYLDAHGRAFSWEVASLPGVNVNDASFWFGGKNSGGDGWLVEGSVAEVDASTWLAKAELLKTDTEGLPASNYKWSGELRDSEGNEITRVKSSCDQKVALVDKQT